MTEVTYFVALPFDVADGSVVVHTPLSLYEPPERLGSDEAPRLAVGLGVRNAPLCSRLLPCPL